MAKQLPLDFLEPTWTCKFFSGWALVTTKPLEVVTTPAYWKQHHADRGLRVGDRVEVMANLNGDAVEHGRFIVGAVARNAVTLREAA